MEVFKTTHSIKRLLLPNKQPIKSGETIRRKGLIFRFLSLLPPNPTTKLLSSNLTFKTTYAMILKKTMDNNRRNKTDKILTDLKRKRLPKLGDHTCNNKENMHPAHMQLILEDNQNNKRKRILHKLIKKMNKLSLSCHNEKTYIN